MACRVRHGVSVYGQFILGLLGSPVVAGVVGLLIVSEGGAALAGAGLVAPGQLVGHRPGAVLAVVAATDSRWVGREGQLLGLLGVGHVHGRLLLVRATPPCGGGGASVNARN